MRQIPLTAIQDAAQFIYSVARRTPLVRMDLPQAATERLGGAELCLKLEVLQPIGSF